MGFNNERGSLNQYSLMFDYIKQSGALGHLKSLFIKTTDFRAKAANSELSRAEKIEITLSGKESIPVVAVDAGMAVFFKDSPYEMVVIKVAGAGEKPLKTDLASVLSPGFIHVLTGKVKNPKVFSEEIEELKLKDKANENLFAAQELNRLLLDTSISNLASLMDEDILEGSFHEELIDWVLRAKKVPELDNLARELIEWSYLLQACKKAKQNVLLVKDGSLITNQFGSGLALAKRLNLFFRGETSIAPYMIGVVKESRFIKDEGHIVSRSIMSFAKTIQKNGFFKIPHSLEVLLDPTPIEQKAVQRVFLSINQGKKVYEVQIPLALYEDAEAFNFVAELLLTQVTNLYGGSVAANSFAHKAASLSEAEARSLEKQLKEIIEKTTKE